MNTPPAQRPTPTAICPLCTGPIAKASALVLVPPTWPLIRIRLFALLARAAPSTVPMAELEHALYGRPVGANRLAANITNLRRALERAKLPWTVDSICLPNSQGLIRHVGWRLAPLPRRPRAL